MSIKSEFDQRFDRRNTGSIKWDGMKEFYNQTEALPFWIADMDFKSPEAVIEAATRRAEHGIYGYPNGNGDVFKALVSWTKRRHGIEVETSWMTSTPGVVTALALAVQTYTQVGEGIVIQPPVYPPFFEVVEHNERRLLQNPLLFSDDKWVMDLEGLEALFQSEAPKMMIFCNPHNPLGIVWTMEEVDALASLCKQYGVFLISDEIHGDLVFKSNSFASLLAAPSVDWERAMVATAPSKTFNIAGMFYSIVLMKDKRPRTAFRRSIEKVHLIAQNAFNVPMAEAAYEHGDEWLDALLSYLEDNAALLHGFVAEQIPQLNCRMPEGTYLAWLDMRRLNLEQKQLMSLLLDHGIAVSDGKAFGEEGIGFIRFNFGCPRSMLLEGLEALKKAVQAQV